MGPMALAFYGPWYAGTRNHPTAGSRRPARIDRFLPDPWLGAQHSYASQNRLLSVYIRDNGTALLRLQW